METDRCKYLYLRYLDNNCSQEEINELYSIIRKSMFTKEDLFSVEYIVNNCSIDIQLNPKTSEDMRKRILNLDQKKAGSPNIKLFYKYTSAAAILLISFSIFYIYFYRQSVDTKVFTNNTKDVIRFVLEDSSEVILKSGSQIRQMSDFKQDTVRLIKLKGEAFFAVAKRADQPFVVHSDDGFEIRVLGTRFHLNFQDDNKEVVLTEGKLSIANNKDKVVVNPGYKAVYSKISNTFQLNEVDTLMYTSWVNRQLYFKDTPIKEVINQLNIIYETKKLQVQPEVEELQFTGYLPSENLNQCKEILKSTFINQKLTFL